MSYNDTNVLIYQTCAYLKSKLAIFVVLKFGLYIIDILCHLKWHKIF